MHASALRTMFFLAALLERPDAPRAHTKWLPVGCVFVAWGSLPQRHHMAGGWHGSRENAVTPFARQIEDITPIIIIRVTVTSFL